MLKRSLISLLAVIIMVCQGLSGCAVPRVSAEDRLFLDRSLEFVGAYSLPTTVNNQQVGGLSAITYDHQRDRFYAVSETISEQTPARFYTLKLNWDTTNPTQSDIRGVEVIGVTPLTSDKDEAYPPHTIAPAGVALSPQQSLFISSAHLDADGVAPLVGEFDLETGKLRRRLPMPNRFLPSQGTPEEPIGVREDQAFAALTLSTPSWNPKLLEPFRVFTATAAPLVQDQPAEPAQAAPSSSNRLLHYLIGDGPPVLIAEHAYPLDSSTTEPSTLQELLTLDQGGHFLSLEQSQTNGTYHNRIYQLAMGSATDTSGLASLGNAQGIEPIRKQLLLDLGELDSAQTWDLQGMAIGPRLPDGSPSVVLVSNNHEQADQPTQLLLFRLQESKSASSIT